MARYGRVKIGSNENYIKFENVAARRDFAEAFEAYHNAHEHDGEIPSFEEIHTKDVNSYHTKGAPTWGDKYLTIDGYKANEIYEYHTHEGYGLGPNYKPPKCCVSPLIVLDTVNIGGDGPFVDSGTLERHPLSAVFGDMPDDDFQSLLESVGDDGFFDPLIRMHEGKVLDGWHRYRAALALNIVRRLRFTVWQDEDEGDPKAFVLARNIDRRHLTPGQRAQIVVEFNEMFSPGVDRRNLNAPNGAFTKKELAKKVGVGTGTIDRAIAVKKSGKSKSVISGEKTAGEVLREKARQQWQKTYTKVRVAWMDCEELSKSVEWNDFVAVAIEQHDLPSLSAETFTHADERIKSDDIQLLNLESVSLGTLAAHLRNPSSWVLNLIGSDTDDDAQTEARINANKARERMWENFHESELLDGIEPDDFLKAACAHHRNWGLDDIPEMEDTDIPEIWEARFNLLTTQIQTRPLWIQEFIEKAGQAEVPPQTTKEEADEMKREYPTLENFDKPEPEPQQEPDPEQIQQEHQEHVQRLKELPDEIRKAIPAWQEELCIEGTITLKLLLNARCHLEYGRERGPDPFFKEEMEELLQLMLSNDDSFGDKVCELLDVESEPAEVDFKQELAEVFGRNGFPNGVVGSIQIEWGTADKDYCAMFGQHPNPNARAISEIPEALLIALVELAVTGKFHVYGNGVEPIIFERATRAKEDA